jgi:DNA-binding CsgD family transcriptional regulator
MDLVAEINRITPAVGDPGSQLAKLWEPIRRIVPFAAAWVGIFDPEQRRYTTVAAVGHDRSGRSYLESRAFADQIEAIGLLQRREPMRLGDTPAYAAALPSWSEHWASAGYCAGLAVPLIARDGRHLGLLALHTDSPAHPTAGERDLMGAVAPLIAAAVDPINAIAGLAQLVAGARASVVVSRSGAVHSLPDMPTHPLLTTDSGVVSVAVENLKDRKTQTAFLCPCLDHENPDHEKQVGYVRVTGLACPPRAPYDLVALVLISPAGDLRGLTPRELEILGLVIDGCVNQSIAERLFITERTVAAHLEHIRAKLHAPTRTAAAVKALRHALYVPHPLVDMGADCGPAAPAARWAGLGEGIRNVGSRRRVRRPSVVHPGRAGDP